MSFFAWPGAWKHDALERLTCHRYKWDNGQNLRRPWQVGLQGNPIYHNNITPEATTNSTKKGGS